MCSTDNMATMSLTNTQGFFYAGEGYDTIGCGCWREEFFSRMEEGGLIREFLHLNNNFYKIYVLMVLLHYMSLYKETSHEKPVFDGLTAIE
jgi:hypothetical protein